MKRSITLVFNISLPSLPKLPILSKRHKTILAFNGVGYLGTLWIRLKLYFNKGLADNREFAYTPGGDRSKLMTSKHWEHMHYAYLNNLKKKA